MTQSFSGGTWVARAISIVVGLGCSLVAVPAAHGAGLASELGPGVTVDRQEETGKVGFVGTRAGDPLDVGLATSAPAPKVAKAFLSEHASSFGLTGAETGLTVTETQPALAGGKTVRLAQTYRDLAVFAGEFVVNLDGDGNVLSVLGEATPSPDAQGFAAINASEAADAATAAIARGEDVSADELTATEPKLQLYDPRLIGAPGPFQQGRTSWVLDVRGGPLSGIDELVVVDAKTGAVAVNFSNDEDALDRQVCHANNTTSKVPCTAPFVRIEGGAPVADDNDDVNRAYDFAGDTYDFFFDGFGLDSLDGAGMTLIQTVDFCQPGTCPNYQNAFWNGQQMVYGEGFTADDVVGHELTHGVTDFSSHLFYYQQSGAINESMSDVFGEFIDLTNLPAEPAADRWKLAEGLPGIPNGIRNMADPPLFNDPDRMQSPNYTADPNELDGGGVHTNSGVNNKTAYLITDGTTNEPGGVFNGQTISGIGITKAARIYYTVNSSMLISGSDYADLANAMRQACTNLAGTATDGITPADCAEVDKALLATEMDENPANSPTPSPAVCPTGAPSNVFFDDLENTASGNWVIGQNSGAVSFFYPQNPNAFVPPYDATYTTSGDFNIFGLSRSTAADTFIRTNSSFAIPPNAFSHFNHAYGFEDGAAAFDGGVVEYSTAGAAGPWTDAGSLIAPSDGDYNGTIASATNPLNGRAAFVRESNGYGATRLDLSSLAGQNVMFRFRMGTDSSVNDVGWYIDDFRIHTCGAAPSLSIDDASIIEGNAGSANLDFTVDLSQDAAVATGFDFATSNGTAVAPGDYAATNGSGSIGVGNNSTTVSVPINGDVLDEANETLTVTISNPGGGATIADATATGTINDNDPTPTLSIDDVTVSEGNAGQANATLTVSLNTASGQAVGVNFATADGSATQPADYDQASGPKTIAAGATSTTIDVPVNGDTIDELDESFVVNLSSPSAATIGDGQGQVTITDDDVATAPPPPPSGGGGAADTTPPDTTIVSGPKKKTKKKKATFAFSSTEPGSTFECKLDKASFAPCTSPAKVRAKKGKHRFRVRASDAAGNTDPTPASHSWKVKKKKKK